MTYYLNIQFKRFCRKIRDFGVHPIAGGILLCILFFGLSYFLFSRGGEYAIYIYLFLAVSYLLNLSFIKEREFLKLALSRKNFLKLRLKENLLLSVPFMLFMLFQFELFGALGLFLASLLLAKIEMNHSVSFEFKTPFSNNPFEFARGFRKNFWVYLIAYALTGIAIYVGNMNLGLFSILILGLTCGHFYSLSEPDFYVWAYHENSRQFLNRKIKIAVVQQFLGILPMLIALLAFFPSQAIYLLGITVIAILFLLTNLVLKYAHFPGSIEVVQMILIPLIIVFPPLMLAIIPFYYSKAQQQLKTITRD